MNKKVDTEWIKAELIRLSGKDSVIQCVPFTFRIFKNIQMEDCFANLNRQPGHKDREVHNIVSDLVNEAVKASKGKFVLQDYLNSEPFKKKVHKAILNEVINLYGASLPNIDFKECQSEMSFFPISNVTWKIDFTLRTKKINCVSLSSEKTYFISEGQLYSKAIHVSNIDNIEL